MTDIHKILTEWTYRLDSGYPKTDSDYEVLRDVLVEKTDLNKSAINNIVNRSKGLTEQKQQLNERSTDYDNAIRSRLGLEEEEPIPQVDGDYPLNAGQLTLTPSDAELVRRLWPETLNSSIIGKGEVALYWLYQYQNPPKDTIDMRGDDQPDLNIAGSNAEVKSYGSHKKRIGLGRFSKFKDSRRIVSILFGIQTLTNLFTEDKKVYSDMDFGAKELIASFQSLQALDVLENKQELIQQFPLFKTMYDQINELKSNLNLEDGYTPMEGAAAVLKRLLTEKFEVKPGNHGYIVNLLDKDPANIYTFEVDLEALEDEQVLKHVVISGAAIKANYWELFGKG